MLVFGWVAMIIYWTITITSCSWLFIVTTLVPDILYGQNVSSARRGVQAEHLPDDSHAKVIFLVKPALAHIAHPLIECGIFEETSQGTRCPFEL